MLTTNLASALLLWGMGALVLWQGATGATAYAPDAMLGLYLHLRRLGDGFTEWAGPSGAIVVGAAILVLLLARHARSKSVPVDEDGQPR